MTRILTVDESIKFKQALHQKRSDQVREADNYGCSRVHFNYVINRKRPATPSFIDFIHQTIVSHLAA